MARNYAHPSACLFVVLAWTLTASAGPQSTLAPGALPSSGAPDGNDATIVDTLRQGLVVWSVNAYCPSRDWSEYVVRVGQARPGLLQNAFGVSSNKALEPEVEDLHVRLLGELKERILHGALRESDWGLKHELTLNVRELSVVDDSFVEAPGLRASGTTVRLKSGVLLTDLSTRKTICKEELTVSKRRVPHGPSVSIGDLVHETVDSVYVVLKSAYQARPIRGTTE